MYYYNKNSRKKVVHAAECFCIRNRPSDAFGCFETLQEVEANGYRLCRHCSLLARQYRKECAALTEYCRKNAVSIFFDDRFIGIYTPHSHWRLILNEGNEAFSLYHENSYESKRDADSAVPGYHLQRVCKGSVQGYLEYVVEHERYRRMNPLYIREQKQLPRKGTKRYKKQQAKAERYARRKAIARVLTLIDGLNVHAQTEAVPI